ncbi:hypothetical protein MTR67_002559 [Solanum verrucosum]|uniref:Tf2-1-like SH3-like domain-containing protein n=1 Tax=Solanum verrucosum TaxID=315347 RepID=A0AAF0T8W7_SOLVR|nr:hypothetical protein MTR67_002559 [Solanum verrucosum]
MLRACIMEFEAIWDKHLALIEFAYNNIYQSSIGMPLYEALYGRKYRTTLCWTEVCERKLIGPEIVQQIEDKVEMIKDRLKISSDRQNSYANLRRRDIEYKVGDKSFLKVSPWKKIMRFCKKGKLSPRFIGPYEILERVEPVAYKAESIEVNSDLTYKEEPILIQARELKQLRNKRIPLVKLLWRNILEKKLPGSEKKTLGPSIHTCFGASIM